MLKKRTYRILVCLIIINLIQIKHRQVHATHKETKIGIFFGNTLKNQVKLKSSKAFGVGYYEDKNFVKLGVIDKPLLIIRKDGCFSLENMKIEEISPYSEWNQQRFGPYHLEYYHDLSYQEAEKRVKELKSIGINSYIAVIGLTINVWGSSYFTHNDALWEANNGYMKPKICQISEKRIAIHDPETREILILFGDMTHGIGLKSEDEIVTLISGNSSSYRGGIEFKRVGENENMTISNVIDMEQYLYSVINGEIESWSHPEAIKTQAVIARTYAIRNHGKHKGSGFDLCNSQHCQVYKGYNIERKNSIDAANATKGQIITYNNRAIESVYSSCMGEFTEDAKNVWGHHRPYLVSVPTNEDLSNNWIYWSNTLNQEEVTECMAKSGYYIGNVNDINIIEVSPANRVMKLEVVGEYGTKIFIKENTRLIFPTPSQCYQIEKTYNDEGNPIFEFHGAGRGHGVGLSQYGAKNMAENGNNYLEIIKHFYKNTSISQIY